MYRTFQAAILSSAIKIAYQQRISEYFLPLPETHPKATLFYKPCIVQSQWLFWVDQFNLQMRTMSAQTRQDTKESRQNGLNLLQTF